MLEDYLLIEAVVLISIGHLLIIHLTKIMDYA